MTGEPIGYYVHHHGEGHRQRAMAIAAQMPGRVTLLGTGLGPLAGSFDVLDLPDDRLEGGFSGLDHCADRPSSLHYAPLRHAKIQERIRAIAAWVAAQRPAVMVVDVSVEIAMLARLCSTPTIYVRLAGARWDTPHLDAFRGAQALLAPFDARCEDAFVPEWVQAKTSYVAGLGVAPAPDRGGAKVILVAFGRGGSRISAAELVKAARSTPDRRWRVIGPIDQIESAPVNLEIAGWVQDHATEIATAAVVVGGAGDGVLSAVAAAGKPFVCIPEDRPFGEQHAKASALDAAQAAIVLPQWADPDAWPQILARAERLDPQAIGAFHEPCGAAIAAALIERWADQ